MSWSDPETDILKSIEDFGKQAKANYLRSLNEPPPRFLIPKWLAEYHRLTQEDLDNYWLEVI